MIQTLMKSMVRRLIAPHTAYLLLQIMMKVKKGSGVSRIRGQPQMHPRAKAVGLQLRNCMASGIYRLTASL
jgi:hypothetical protein